MANSFWTNCEKLEIQSLVLVPVWNIFYNSRHVVVAAVVAVVVVVAAAAAAIVVTVAVLLLLLLMFCLGFGFLLLFVSLFCGYTQFPSRC